jgi:hypothetical protein
MTMEESDQQIKKKRNLPIKSKNDKNIFNIAYITNNFITNMPRSSRRYYKKFLKKGLTLWSSISGWNQQNQQSSNFVISSGQNILLDVSPPPFYSLTINGTLTFKNTPLNLTVGWFVILFN